MNTVRPDDAMPKIGRGYRPKRSDPLRATSSMPRKVTVADKPTVQDIFHRNRPSGRPPTRSIINPIPEVPSPGPRNTREASFSDSSSFSLEQPTMGRPHPVSKPPGRALRLVSPTRTTWVGTAFCVVGKCPTALLREHNSCQMPRHDAKGEKIACIRPIKT